jgi:hypothetical protein
VASSRGSRPCVTHTPDKARLIGSVPEVNRRVSLGMLSEIRPKKAPRSLIVSEHGTAFHRLGAAHRRATKQTIGRQDANCAPTKRSEPECLAPRVPLVSDDLRGLPRLKFEAAFIAPHSASADYNYGVLFVRSIKDALRANFSSRRSG